MLFGNLVIFVGWGLVAYSVATYRDASPALSFAPRIRTVMYVSPRVTQNGVMLGGPELYE